MHTLKHLLAYLSSISSAVPFTGYFFYKGKLFIEEMSLKSRVRHIQKNQAELQITSATVCEK